MQLRRGQILLCRVGPMGFQRQTHTTGNVAPVKRGIWAFPFGYQDAFFYHHVWSKQLPKRLQNEALNAIANKEEQAARCEEAETKLREIRKREKLKRFWHGGPFYSRIHPSGRFFIKEWFLWNSPKDWAEVASKTLKSWMRHGDSLFQIEHSADHLEVFIPGMQIGG